MNIRKIIREELEDWDWVDNSTAHKDMVIYFNPPIKTWSENPEDKDVNTIKMLWDELHENGVHWASGDPLKSGDNYEFKDGILSLIRINQNGILSKSGYWVKNVDDVIRYYSDITDEIGQSINRTNVVNGRELFN